ncbi:MAG: archease [Burkholderiales bacterium]|nr:archease [Burkholderiales bacterium]
MTGAPSYGYFEHEADIGVIGRGATLADAFVAAARAAFAIMCPPEGVARAARIAFDFEEDDDELALVTWLNLLLAHARERGLVLGEFALARDGRRWHGEAWGEPWSAHHERGTEVKGATLTMLSVRRVPEGWEARCVVDV